MCGIAGVVSRDREALGSIAAMTRALRHRGPDDEGYLLASSVSGRACAHRGADTRPEITDPSLPGAAPEGSDVAFGHRRLAILDLSPAGHGPMPSADRQLWITYNGEVYNYVELRDELRARGHAFRTGTDTEVLLAAYAEWGEDALPRLNGMWSFAIYDTRRRTVFCARDRFGVKPFFYHDGPALFAFASEIKGLLAHPAVPRRVHEPALAGFLCRGALDEGEQTFFEGIRSLPAAHKLTLDITSGRHAVSRWYDLPEREEKPADPSALRALLEDAVRLRLLRSDVDVGTCLSGGLDSSSIVALTARLRQGAEDSGRHTFSVLYDDRGLSEAPFVDAVVASTGAIAHRTSATSADLATDLAALVRHQDEPIPSAGPFSHWRVMRLAHEHGIKVLLDGQGADEILGGYHYHYGPFLGEVSRRRGTLAALEDARQAAGVTGRPLAFFLGLLAYQRLPLPAFVREKAAARFSTHRHVPLEMIDPALLARLGRLPGSRHAPRPTLLAERKANLWSTSLPALLRYEDRNSMAFGIEARTPFLDYRLVEHAMALPADALVREGWTKSVLRDAMAGLLPEAVRLRRDKLGFATPETRWLTELAPQIREWLGPASHLRTRLRPGALAAWLGEDPKRLARRPGLWRLIAAEHWLRYVEGAA
jgi:asparagine synthase (glutamine-hydrolysing)